jgi:hypothetical protein
MNAKPERKLSAPLERWYIERGYQDALAMDEEAPVVEYMAGCIRALLVNATYIDDRDAVIVAWDAGFRAGIVERVTRWWGAQEAVQHVVKRGPVYACASRLMGTLHLRRRGKA